MRKKKRNPTTSLQNSRGAQPKPVFSSPFKDLGKLLAEQESRKPEQKPLAQAKSTKREAGSGPPPIDDDAALQEAYRGVRPLGGGHRVPVKLQVSRAVVSEESEVLAELYDLVSGQGEFDLTETEEYVEGARAGIDPRLVSRLRHGEFAVQNHIDLHGMTRSAAREVLDSFILNSVRGGLRTVLVVHGRGLRSPGGHPVLKHATAQWLSHGVSGAHVLAFTTARAADGGAGAMYVLLRRDRRRAAFDVLKGTKRHD